VYETSIADKELALAVTLVAAVPGKVAVCQLAADPSLYKNLPALPV
jgi:hypothetical protein